MHVPFSHEVHCQSRIPYVTHSRTPGPFSIHPPAHVTKASCSRKGSIRKRAAWSGGEFRLSGTASQPTQTQLWWEECVPARPIDDLVCVFAISTSNRLLVGRFVSRTRQRERVYVSSGCFTDDHVVPACDFSCWMTHHGFRSVRDMTNMLRTIP